MYQPFGPLLIDLTFLSTPGDSLLPTGHTSSLSIHPHDLLGKEEGG